MALTTAREITSKKVDEALAAELGSAQPDRAALIVIAMADRRETVILPAVLAAATRGPLPVRLAAIGALGRVGDASCLPPLLEIALEKDAELGQAARGALAELPGETVNQQILARLSKADGALYPLLIQLVGERRIDAMTDLQKALEHSDKSVRAAALTSLGATVSPRQLNVLITRAVTPKLAEDAEIAQQALKAAAIRMPDREACAKELAAALERAPATSKSALLDILGAVGGTKALQTLAAAARGNDPQLQDVSSRLLGEWMTIDAAPVLLDLARTAPGDKFQVRALRGYLRIARQFTMSEPDRAAMCDEALAAARFPAEQRLVMDVVRRYPAPEMLKVTTKALRVPDLKDDATQATLLIAQRVGSKGGDIRELLSKSGLERMKLEIIKAEYGAGSTQVNVTETLRGRITDLPLITLSAPSYNASFGGDPAPGTTKQLKVQYRLNGKAGEATFAENSPLLFTMPR
jgi:HEAT repeat protein